MTNHSEFKQQTFALLREQTIQLKQKQKEATFKDQQIKFLKQTIETLEEQNSEIVTSNINLKNKLEVVMNQVKKYDEEVVRKIYKQNQQLINKVQQFQQQLLRQETEIVQVSSKYEESKDENTKLKEKLKNYEKQMEEMKESEEKNVAKKNKWESQIANLSKTIQDSERQIGRLEAKQEQLQLKLKNSQKQNQFLISKCEQSVSGCEQKIRKFKDSHIKKSVLDKVKEEIEKQRALSHKIARENKKLTERINAISLEANSLKQKMLAAAYDHEIKLSLLDSDVRTLKQSLALYKRVGQFQSIYSEQFQLVYTQMTQLRDMKQQLSLKQQMLIVNIQDLTSKTQKLSKNLQEKMQQNYDLQDKFNRQVEGIQSSYQGKIMQLSIKIKQQQKALYQLSVRQQQNKDLSAQYDKLTEEHIQMKQSLQNTINQYQKQNERLLQQIKQLCELCNQNINTKNTMNNLKHTICNLLCLVYYLHLHIMRNREAKRKLYLPFINFYYEIDKQIQNPYKSRNKNIRKWKACVWVIVALQRMQKSLNCDSDIAGSKGIMRYCKKSLNLKEKIDDYNHYSQEMIKTSIQQEGQIGRLIEQSKYIFKWRDVHNFTKINIQSHNLSEFSQI